MSLLKAGVDLGGLEVSDTERTIWTVMTAPFIYSLIVPLLLLDIWVTIYQQICFRAYGMPRVRRADYVVVDRQLLPYLNLVGKLNCAYCSYANGVIAYVREIGARTEQYWCPIRHAGTVPGAHDRYAEFADYGDAQAFERTAERLRENLRRDG